MTADSSWELQQAVYGALTGDGALMAMITGVHDHVPQDTVFPYVTIGDGTARDWRALGILGAEMTFMLHVWSRSRGRREVMAILAEIRRILDGATLTIPNHILVWMRFSFSETSQDPDGLTYHGTTSFRALVHDP